MFSLVACGNDEPIEDDVLEPIVVSFDARGGSPVNPLEWLGDETIPVIPESEREGYAFDGWFIDEGLTTLFDVEALEPGDAIIVYAGWSELIQVNWEIEGETVQTETVRKGEPLTAPSVPEIEGFIFTGWMKGSGESIDAPYVLEESTTLFAVYEAALFTLSFETDDLVMVEDLTLPFGSLLTLPSPEVVDHVFAGWYIDQSFTTPFDANTMPSESSTLYGRFIDLTQESFSIDDIRVAEIREARLEGVQVIYSTPFPNEGFTFTLVRDDSGTLAVQTSENFDVGAVVSFDAMIDFDGAIPYVYIVENIEEHGVEVVEFEYETVSIAALNDIDRSDPANWYRAFKVEDALFTQEAFSKGLLDVHNGINYLLYNVSFSGAYDEIFDELSSPLLSMGVVLLPEVPVFDHVLFYVEAIEAVEASPVNDEALLNLIEEALISLYNDETFFVGQPLQLLDVALAFDIALSYEATGEYAEAFDDEESAFGFVRETTFIDFAVTLERNESSRSFTMPLRVDPIPITPIGNAAQSSSLTFEGIVVAVGYQYFVLKDDTGMIGVQYLDDSLFIDVGQHLVIDVWTSFQEKPILSADLAGIVAVIDSDVAYTLESVDLDIDALDVHFETNDLAVYTTLEGLLEQPNVFPYAYRLVVGDETLYIRVSDEGVALDLHARVGEIVRIDGIVFEYALGHDPQAFALFFFEGEDGVETIEEGE